MIKIVAINTAIAKQHYASKTIVNIFQLVYALVALLMVSNLDKPPGQLFYICIYTLFGLLLVRLIVGRLQKVCGECATVLEKSNRAICPECGSYNVYDLKLWPKHEYADIKAIRRTEIGRVVQNVAAPIIVLLMFSAPVMYFFLVIEKDIYQLNQQRREAFKEIRPLILRYKAENETFPLSLGELVPDYMDDIPVVLKSRASGGKVFRINYQGDESSAKFIFYTTRIPGAVASYDVAENSYWFESKLAKLRW